MTEGPSDAIPKSSLEGAGVPARRLAIALGFLVAGLSAYVLSGLLSRWPTLVESVFVRGWARTVIPTLSRVSGMVPLPLAEVLAAAYVGFRLWTAGRGGWHMLQGRTRPGTTLLSGLAVGLRDLGIGLLLFYGLWGFHYARESAAVRLALPQEVEVSDTELLHLSGQLADVANLSYRTLHGSEDAAAPTAMPERWGGLREALHRGWARSATRLPLDPLVTARFGPPKPLLTSPLLAYLGITGLYSPFTAEPLVVGTTPAVSLGLSLAHEQAHQRGITDEGEATFLGFVAAMESGDPLLRYSAAVRARTRILSVLASRDSAAAREERNAWLPGVRRDLEDLRTYRLRHRGPTARIATRVNDAYLRANRVAGGVESYDQATRLLLRYARLRGGSLAGEETARPRGAPNRADDSPLSLREVLREVSEDAPQGAPQVHAARPTSSSPF